MSAKALSQLFWFFCILCVLFIVQARKDGQQGDEIKRVEEASIEQLSEMESKEDSENSYQQKFPEFHQSFAKFQAAKTDAEKLNAISRSLKNAKQEGFDNAAIIRMLHVSAANIHQSRWHLIFAIKHLKKSQQLAYDASIERRLKKLSSYLKKIDKERGLNEEYIATKDTGPAKALRGNVLVAYVFVDDGIATRWSKKTKRRTKQVLKLVQAWKKNKALEYGISNINFINKTFVAKRNPGFNNRQNRFSEKHSSAISFNSDSAEIRAYVDTIANSLGEKSIGAFIQKQMTVSGADQGVVILHTNLNQRSFAQRCGYTHRQNIFVNGRHEVKLISKCKDEYVMLMEEVKRNRWDKIHYAQAHEMMHVFGAADLYNIKKAADYSVTDIMNFQSKQLVHSQIDPITAYAIGWQKSPPPAPFTIIER